MQIDTPTYKNVITWNKFFMALILSAILGMGIGYLMGQNTTHAPIIIEQGDSQ